jgi:hypothetical protein
MQNKASMPAVRLCPGARVDESPPHALRYSLPTNPHSEEIRIHSKIYTGNAPKKRTCSSDQRGYTERRPVAMQDDIVCFFYFRVPQYSTVHYYCTYQYSTLLYCTRSKNRLSCQTRQSAIVLFNIIIIFNHTSVF